MILWYERGSPRSSNDRRFRTLTREEWYWNITAINVTMALKSSKRIKNKKRVLPYYAFVLLISTVLFFETLSPIYCSHYTMLQAYYRVQHYSSVDIRRNWLTTLPNNCGEIYIPHVCASISVMEYFNFLRTGLLLYQMWHEDFPTVENTCTRDKPLVYLVYMYLQNVPNHSYQAWNLFGFKKYSFSLAENVRMSLKLYL